MTATDAETTQLLVAEVASLKADLAVKSARIAQLDEAAFTVILDGAVRHMETNKKNVRNLNEEGLSAVLAGTITVPGLTVTQEPNSNGHVDLRIEADHCSPSRVKLGEAKICGSPSYHMKGIGQLVVRYSTGRDTAGLLINYVREPDIKGIVERLRKAIDKAHPSDQVGGCADHTLRWSFVTKHKHRSGEELIVDHVGLNLA